MKKTILILPILSLLVTASVVSAHVTVNPREVGMGKYQTFTVSVPSEKDLPTTGVRLVIPEGLEHVSPTVKPGWSIRLVTGEASMGGEHGDAAVKEIIWTGGSIPGHYRDDFSFSAKVPASETTLLWRAYQTYRDGTVVEWALGPNEEQPKNAEGAPDFSAKGPASITKVINDLAPTRQSANQNLMPKPVKGVGDSMILSILAVLISTFSLYIAYRKQ